MQTRYDLSVHVRAHSLIWDVPETVEYMKDLTPYKSPWFIEEPQRYYWPKEGTNIREMFDALLPQMVANRCRESVAAILV